MVSVVVDKFSQITDVISNTQSNRIVRLVRDEVQNALGDTTAAIKELRSIILE